MCMATRFLPFPNEKKRKCLRNEHATRVRVEALIGLAARTGDTSGLLRTPPVAAPLSISSFAALKLDIAVEDIFVLNAASSSDQREICGGSRQRCGGVRSAYVSAYVAAVSPPGVSGLSEHATYKPWVMHRVRDKHARKRAEGSRTCTQCSV